MGALVAGVLAFAPAVARAAPAADAHNPIRVDAPRQTDRGSVVLHGRAYPRAEVRVNGGVLPVTAFAGGDGAFSAEVLLRPEHRNCLTVTAYSAGRRASATIVVRQRLDHPAGRLTGRVVDAATRTPVSGATVRYADKRTATTDAEGRYTLAGMPEGGVAVSARAAHHLGGLAVAEMAGDQGAAEDLLVQAPAAPVRVGRAGGSFSGPGWQVQVPAGALRRTAGLRLTTLETSGVLDTLGSPVVALSPKGLHFAAPITVTIDPGVAGLDPASTVVVGADPGGPTVRTLRSRVVGGKLVVRLRTLDGFQIRMAPAPGHADRRTAWRVVLGQIGPHGEVDLRTALQAFSLAATPLPGVKVPVGPTGRIRSASGPIRWILAHRSELSPDQQRIVMTWLDSAFAGAEPAGMARAASGIRALAAAPDLPRLKALVRQATDLIGQHLGRPLGLTVKVAIGPAGGGPRALGGAVARDADGGLEGPARTCEIEFTPRLFTMSENALRETVYHEVFHCFAAEIFPNLATYHSIRTLAPWVIEGQAEWVGDSLNGTDEGTPYHWGEYLLVPGQSLFTRAYDALGFYSHLAESGDDPWRVIDPMLRALITGGSEAAFTAALAGGDAAAVLDSWPSGYARGRRPGVAWDTTGPGITNERPEVETAAVPDGSGVTMAAPTVAAELLQLDLTAEVTRFEVSGEVHGRLGPSSGDDVLAGRLSGDWCTRSDGQCGCPDGTVGAGTDLPALSPGVAWLALTGGLGSGVVTVTGHKLEDECKTRPPRPGDGGLPPGGVPPGPGGPPDGGTGPDSGPSDPGPGGSYGDPHFVSFDGSHFSFQGAGDYVLAESTTDDFEVQGRYTRLSADIPSISINRGVASRVGTSVIAFGDDATTERGKPPVVTLDGRPFPLNPGPTGLPGGATLTFSATRGAVVRWPDGTELAAGRWVGDNAFLTLAPARWGHVRGLLGNADRDLNNDMTARDGTVVRDPLDIDQAYRVFGASWRVEGTASFFRSTMPPDRVLPVVPPEVATVASLPEAARAAAERICRDRGLRPGAGLEQCILDVGRTGDAAFAADAAVVAELLRRGVDLGPLGAPVEDSTEIQLGRRVSGSIGTPLHADVYLVDLRAGDTVQISTPGACPGAGTFSITLVAPSGRPIGRTRGDGCGSMGVTGLRESGRYQLRVFDSGGFTGGYEFQVDGGQTGLTCQATEVAPNDDESGPEVTLPFTLDFRGRRFSSLWVNNNGNVTFDGPLSTFTPEPLETISSPIVAAWFADVDTRGPGSHPVRYGSGSVNGRPAFCVDYDQVGYYNQHDDKLNSFQLFIVDRGDVADGAFDIVFRYRRLTWETGDASGGTEGLGGTSAGVGFSNGSGEPGSFLEVAGSRQPGSFLDSSPSGLVRTSTNSDQAGVHVFPIRSG